MLQRFILPTLFFSSLLHAEPGSLEILNLKDLAVSLKLDQYKTKSFAKKIKIAVLDNGFYGYEDEVGASLPADTQCFSNSETVGEQCKEEFKREEASAAAEDKTRVKPFHGLLIAEIVAQILAKAGNSNYELTLFRTSGLDRLERAVDSVVAQNFDIAIYSDVWEFGGNSDGKGFVNAVVNKALAAGVIWINAAGNYGRATRVGPVDSAGDWVTFKDGKKRSSQEVKVRCALARACDLRLVLTWNDFKDNPDEGSDKSLALYLYDEKGKQIDQSEKIQMRNPPRDDKRYSLLPRQMLVHKLEPGTPKQPKVYSVKVKVVSHNFSPADRLRVMATGIGIEVADPSLGETILPPADNPGVIVIGASDAMQTSESSKLGVPRIYLKSTLELKNGLRPFQSSTSAGIAGAMAALYLGAGGTKAKAFVESMLLGLTQKPSYPSTKKDIPVADKSSVTKKDDSIEIPAVDAKPAPVAKEPVVKSPSVVAVEAMRKPRLTRKNFVAQPVRGNCYQRASLPYSYAAVRAVLGQGYAVPVEYKGWVAIAVNYDYPASVDLYPQRGERVFITPVGAALYSTYQVPELPEEYYEVIALNRPLCN